MPQFFIDPSQIKENEALLSGDEAHHLVRTLRYRAGDHLWFSNGRGTQYEGKILSAHPHEVLIKILQSRTLPKPASSPVMAMALLKQERWDLALKKVVELGCPHILPFVSTRTIPHFEEEDLQRKLTRWQKIALEAAKQSGLALIPKVEPPASWSALLNRFAEFEKIIMPWESEETHTLHDLFQKPLPEKTLILIGPEGGFTKEEAFHARNQGAFLVSLGTQILRAETASIVTLALCQFALKNI